MDVPTPPPAISEPAEFAPSLGFGLVYHQAAHAGVTYSTLALSDSLWLRPGVEAAAGVRLGYGSRLASGYCGEGFLSVMVVPHFRTLFDAKGRTASWRPAAGIELGLSTARRTTSDEPRGTIHDLDSGPAYAAFVVRPLRFRLTHFNVTALGLAYGTSVGGVGALLRVQIDLLTIGIVL